jgi:hypothetical protein
MASYIDIANILDSVATYIDEIESEKTASLKEAKDTRVNKFADKYAAATGEEFTLDLRNKLAQLDPIVLDHLLKVAKNNSNENPESLGGPADIPDRLEPATVKEAAAQAGDRLLNWILT